jgi:phospholipase/carboxylesterase
MGRYLGKSFPQALIVSVAGADESDLGQGFQWFSVQASPKKTACNG